MTQNPQAPQAGLDPPTDDLTSTRVVKILLFSAVVWLSVAIFIRTAGPLGVFAPDRALKLYAATFLATMPLNRLTRRIAGLPAQKMAAVAAVAAIVPPTLEGILMKLFPEVYGPDPAVIGQSAIWLLFAIGVAMMLATLTSLIAGRRLRAGGTAPPIRAGSVRSEEVVMPDGRAGLTHVQFLRFAGCPVCNLHLRSFIRRHAELRAAGVREIVLFHSAVAFIDDYYGELPFDLIADPAREIYARYRVETSPLAVLSPMAWPGLVQGYHLKKAGAFDSTPFGLPADFLIDGHGRIVAVHYGAHSGDQWSVDDVLALAKGERNARVSASMPVAGAPA
jgi:peroxiredoxin